MTRGNFRRFWAAAVAVVSISLWSINAAYGAAGRTPGTFAVSDIGAATYNIPVWAPEGPRQIGPHVAIAYNSGGDNGILGVGWSLSGLSSIALCYTTVGQDGVAGSSPTKLCLDGQSTPASNVSNITNGFNSQQNGTLCTTGP
jgi:hypothetical protein